MLFRSTRDEITGLLETLWRERGLTMVIVTHDSLVAQRAQHTGIMQNGQLIIAARGGSRPAGQHARSAAGGPATDRKPASGAPRRPGIHGT